MNVIQQIELESTFDALGFFKIELSTLTSLGSTILTYLIILAQFNSSMMNNMEVDGEISQVKM